MWPSIIIIGGAIAVFIVLYAMIAAGDDNHRTRE